MMVSVVKNTKNLTSSEKTMGKGEFKVIQKRISDARMGCIDCYEILIPWEKHGRNIWLVPVADCQVVEESV